MTRVIPANWRVLALAQPLPISRAGGAGAEQTYDPMRDVELIAQVFTQYRLEAPSHPPMELTSKTIVDLLQIPFFRQVPASAMAAVQKDGRALKFASPELKGNREIVLAAVTQYGSALVYASQEFEADREIVLAAVTQHGLVLSIASPEFKADREIVLAAVTQ
nr:hypothetical protein [Chlamydiota bacterium]